MTMQLPTALSATDASIVKGMLARGDRQHDIAAWFGVNADRVAEVRAGKKHTDVPTAPEHALPARHERFFHRGHSTPDAGLTVRVPACKNAPLLEVSKMSDVESRSQVALPLPATVTDLLAQRKSMRARSLNDDVDDCHIKLWDNPDYRRWFVAIYPSETIEGSFAVDDVRAADMIRAFAIENRSPIAANARTAAIISSLHVVCRRYGMSRKERRNLVSGEPVQMQDAAE